MAIDTNNRIKAQFFQKWIHICRLGDICNELERKYNEPVISVNKVGNLSIHSKGDGGLYVQVGYIDLSDEEYCELNEENFK